MTEKDNFINICDLTTGVMGLPRGSLSNKSRKLEFQIPRMVASVIARTEEGIHKTIIAKVLNRDRTLIYHYEKRHQPNIRWKVYRDIFNKVYAAYQDLKDSKKIFIDKFHLKEYLLTHGVKESPKAEVIIRITSGKATTIIPTSYFDFSNQLEIIKFILKDYAYKMEIR
tara:strand:- start:19405 stop:19911 length:507 start_codon:yes stop_codon:yes gene_type:complete